MCVCGVCVWEAVCVGGEECQSSCFNICQLVLVNREECWRNEFNRNKIPYLIFNIKFRGIQNREEFVFKSGAIAYSCSRPSRE